MPANICADRDNRDRIQKRHRHHVVPVPKPRASTAEGFWLCCPNAAETGTEQLTVEGFWLFLPKCSRNGNELTYCEPETREVSVCLLQPVVEVLGIVRGVALPVRGHAEHGQGLVDLGEAAQVRLQHSRE